MSTFEKKLKKIKEYYEGRVFEYEKTVVTIRSVERYGPNGIKIHVKISHPSGTCYRLIERMMMNSLQKIAANKMERKLSHDLKTYFNIQWYDFVPEYTI